MGSLNQQIGVAMPINIINGGQIEITSNGKTYIDGWYLALSLQLIDILSILFLFLLCQLIFKWKMLGHIASWIRDLVIKLGCFFTLFIVFAHLSNKYFFQFRICCFHDARLWCVKKATTDKIKNHNLCVLIEGYSLQIQKYATIGSSEIKLTWQLRKIKSMFIVN